jgi:hypothetical protein
MTRFLDGPAVGTTLLLKRAPLFLRAVQDQAGTWDALDQLTDEPRADERIVVYRMVEGPTVVHINRGRNGSGFYRGGGYLLVDPQPSDDVVRKTQLWRWWCAGQINDHVEEDGTITEAGADVRKDS